MKHPLFAAALLSLTASPVLAADSTWISTSSVAYGLPANWNAGVPTLTIGGVFQDLATLQHSLDVGAQTLTAVGVGFDNFPGGSSFTFAGAFPQVFNLRAGAAGSYVGVGFGLVNNDDNTEYLNIPFKIASVNGGSGVLAAQTWYSVGGLSLGAYSGAFSQLDNNGGALTIDGPGNTYIGAKVGSTSARGDIIGAGALIKNGLGTLTLGGTIANSYSGGTILNAGTILAAKINAVRGNLTLNGGLMQMGGYNQALGTLSLGGSAHLDFDGTGGLLPSLTNTISFSKTTAAWAPGATLFLDGWQPGALGVGTNLRFGTDATGLTAGDLSQIIITGGFEQYQLSLNSSGYLVATVPEPSTISLLGGFGLAIAFIIRRRKA